MNLKESGKVSIGGFGELLGYSQTLEVACAWEKHGCTGPHVQCEEAELFCLYDLGKMRNESMLPG